MQTLDPATDHVASNCEPPVEERQEVKDLASRVSQHPKFSHHNDHALLKRVLIARHHSVDDAYDLWVKWCEWQEKFTPEDITFESVKKELDETQKIATDGHDRYGRPCVIFRIYKHHRGVYPAEGTLRLIIHTLEVAIKESRRKADGYINVVFDLHGVGLNNLDLGLVIGKPGLVVVLQECYPEVVKQVFLYKANALFRGFYRMVEPFLDANLRSKIHVVNGVEGLLETFPKDGLPMEFRPS